ncbi:hypothetical protein AX760_12285 [Pararhizobium antarcticum]|uniref:Uncharacterized protein n=1 Tax=Pararhizobium antarcticum TaxID=1798805 RepID=A0A657LXG1_9HYPH|nr:hypothetical protein AX761_20235 [Rhizobium sp. 58]OJF99525.1 hypothetical protein AX760_12285 [Pararhizobium antarcticum]
MVAEFPELEGDELTLQKEVYAHFGLAFFKFALIEHSLINIMVFSTVGQLLRERKIQSKAHWKNAFDAAEAKAVASTFGNLVRHTSGVQEFTSLQDQLKQAKNLRDYFAHHFMREEAGFFSSDDGCWLLLEKIRDVRIKALSLESDLKLKFNEMCTRFKIPLPTEEDTSKMLEEYRKEYDQTLADSNPNVGWEKDAL